MLAEYAYVLAEGALAYTISDVEELHVWMVQHFISHPLFEQVPMEELVRTLIYEIANWLTIFLKDKDEVVHAIMYGTEESRKVDKQGGKKFPAVFRRIPNKET